MQRRWLDVRGTGPRWDNCLQRVRRGGIKQSKKKTTTSSNAVVSYAEGLFVLYKCWLATQWHAGPDMSVRINNRFNVWQVSWAESDNCLAATRPWGYLTFPALCLSGWGCGHCPRQGSALKPVPVWGIGTRCLCILALWSLCWGGCTCQEAESPVGSATSMVLNCALWLFLCFYLYIIVLSLLPKQSEKRALCGLVEVKTEENAAWWVHTGQNATVTSASTMVSSCTEPLAGLSVQGFLVSSKKGLLSRAAIV